MKGDRLVWLSWCSTVVAQRSKSQRVICLMMSRRVESSCFGVPPKHGVAVHAEHNSQHWKATRSTNLELATMNTRYGTFKSAHAISKRTGGYSLSWEPVSGCHVCERVAL